MAERDLTAQKLRRLFTYNPHTGNFTRIGSGIPAGLLSQKGYVEINIGGQNYLAHRLAWLYVNGEWPADQVDHINGLRADNRIANLRGATHKQNMENRKVQRNNSSGYPGVYLCAGKWRARIKHHGKYIELGNFTDVEDAAQAYAAARARYFTHHRAA